MSSNVNTIMRYNALSATKGNGVYCPETISEYLRRTQRVPDYISNEQIDRYIGLREQKDINSSLDELIKEIAEEK